MNDQFQQALSSRVVIEQARAWWPASIASMSTRRLCSCVGMPGISTKLTDVSEAFVAGTITGEALAS